MGKFQELDLTQISPISHSTYKVSVRDEAKPLKEVTSIQSFFSSLPKIGKAKELMEFAKHIIDAKNSNKPIVFLCGGHVIKTGCSPILIELIKEGFISHIASNGSFAIHDIELTILGSTSEYVEDLILDGSFGMNKKICDFINLAAKIAKKENLGYGEAIGKLLIESKPPYISRSVIAYAYKKDIPYTVHVAIGTDVNHQFPSADGSAIGEASYRDFKIFANTIKDLHNGGVVINLGSAVIMPEVFLKALNIVRNVFKKVNNFITCNFDIINHYRPMKNIVERPVLDKGKGYFFLGYHEIMLPLLATILLNQKRSKDGVASN